MGRHNKGQVPLTLPEWTTAGKEQGINVKGLIADTRNQKG